MIAIEPFLESIFQNIDKLVAGLGDDKRRKAILALRRLHDNMIRLQDRYKTLLTTEQGPSANSADWQYEFVDKTEAFHQQVYSTISTLIHVLIYIGIPGANTEHPSRSVQRFLDFLTRLPQFNDKFREDIDAVLKSVQFRAEYIDHPQGRPAYDWMIYNYFGTVFLVYFAPPSDALKASAFDIKISDPTAPGFSPLIACDQFCVSPPLDRIFEGVVAVINELLYRE